MDIVIKIFTGFMEFLMEAAPFMLLGLFFAGVLKAFLPDDIVKKHIGSNKKGGIFKASAFGVPIPLCSCGVVPAAAGIRKQGAGKGPVVSFLVSTPETGVDSIAITWAMLGPVMAVIRPVAAFLTALFTGSLVALFDKNNNEADLHKDLDHLESSCSSGCCGSHSHDHHEHDNLFKMEDSCGCSAPKKQASFFEKFKRGMNFSFVELIGDISGWFILGVLFAAVIAAFITPETVHAVSSKNPFLIMLLMLAVSVPLYVCATSSTPIAVAFLLAGVSPGAVLVFLLAGPATNAASFSVISKIIGKKSAFIYLLGIIISSLAAGFAADYIFGLMNYKIIPVSGTTGEGVGFMIEAVSTALLSCLLLYPYAKKISGFFKTEKVCTR